MITYLDLEFPGRLASRDDVFTMIERSEKVIQIAKERNCPTIKVINVNGSSTVVLIDRAEAILNKAKMKYVLPI